MKLTINSLNKNFGKKTVLNNINLELTEGVYGILGANGSGKSTLMKIIATVLNPTSGQIRFNNKEISVIGSEYRSSLGYLPQNVPFYKDFTAEYFLTYIAYLNGIDKKDIKEKVSEILDSVGLGNHKKEKIKSFSGGMKQRIGIAQTLINDPKILIVDEPTAGLDPKERIRFRNLLSSISANRIVLLSTHIVSDIDFIAKEIIIIKKGKIVKKNTPQELLNELEDKVWITTIEDNFNTLKDYEENYKVGNIVRNANGVELRIISDEKPSGNSKKVTPNLEDLYLYHFDKEEI